MKILSLIDAAVTWEQLSDLARLLDDSHGLPRKTFKQAVRNLLEKARKLRGEEPVSEQAN